MSSSQFSSLNPELHLLPKCRRLLHPPEPQGLQTRRSRQHLHLVVLTSKSLLQKSLDSEPQAALPHFLQHHRKNPFHEKNVLIVIVFKWTSRGCNVRSDWSVTWHHDVTVALQHLYRYIISRVTERSDLNMKQSCNQPHSSTFRHWRTKSRLFTLFLFSVLVILCKFQDWFQTVATYLVFWLLMF